MRRKYPVGTRFRNLREADRQGRCRPRAARLQHRGHAAYWTRSLILGVDDTIYRALKDLGSHVSARPKAYKQDAEAMDAFKKTSPSAWRTSARNSRRALLPLPPRAPELNS